MPNELNPSLKLALTEQFKQGLESAKEALYAYVESNDVAIIELTKQVKQLKYEFENHLKTQRENTDYLSKQLTTIDERLKKLEAVVFPSN